MGKRMKYRVYVHIPGKCSGCGKQKKWEYFCATYEPKKVLNAFPMLKFKVEECILK